MTQPTVIELQPVLDQLLAEGFEVWTYETRNEENRSLYWFENGRMLNIQPSSWYNYRYNRNVFNLGVSYVPSTTNGSGCGLSPQDGVEALDLLRYRNHPTWVHSIVNYKSLADFINRQRVLVWYKIEKEN